VAVKQGSATVTTGQSDTGAQLPPSAGSKFDPPVESVVSNPLLNFASVAPLWTFASLSLQEFNNPSLYRNNGAGLTKIIFSSGGRFDSQRQQIAGGRAPEYFVDNFSMRSIVAPTPQIGNQNVTTFTFDVYEPYSAGKLLESMQVAAAQNNFFSYLDNAPYLLKLDFAGYDETMAVYSTAASKYFVIRLTKVSFTVDEGGSRYKFEAAPYNHVLYSDTFNITYTDLKLTGTNLKEACKNLTDNLDKNEQQLVKEKRITVPDQYFIEFPVEGSDTSGAESEIASSDFKFDATYGGNFSFGSESKLDQKTGKITKDNLTIDPKKREFHFAQEQSITNILTELVLASSYARDAADSKKDKDGKVKWFKIDAQMELIDTFDPKVGDYPYKIKYRIVPYEVLRTVFDNFTSAFDYTALERKIVKKYNYIYTGQNVDILKFNIEINNLFYVGTNPSTEGRQATSSDPGQQGTAPRAEKKTETGEGGSAAAVTSTAGRRRSFKDPALLERVNHGGSGDKDVDQKIAQAFHEAFLKGSSADLVQVELEVVGDPYWLVDSGIANYFSPPREQGGQVTEDGSANFVGSDTYIYISYRTPMDVNTDTGVYDWPEVGRLGAFTGIYRVTEVESIFLDGTFKQKLTCVRLVGQDAEYIYDQSIDKTPPEKSAATTTSNEPESERRWVPEDSE
jgi:hypothetical protein